MIDLTRQQLSLQMVKPPIGWHMPPEWARHTCCWMSYPSAATDWADDLPRLRRTIADLALAIRRFEAVRMIVAPADEAAARRDFGPAIDLVILEVDDLWMRDIGPTFLVKSGEGVSAAVWRFNVWGEKFSGYDADRSLAQRLMASRKMTAYPAPIVTEGGALHVDGEGTLLVTETSVLNDNRNPGLSKPEAEEIFRHWLGVTQVIWLPGSRVETVTDGHIDGFACFTQPGRVLAELPGSDDAADAREMRENLKALRLARDAKGRSLEIGLLSRPVEVASEIGRFCDCYINFYIANGGVVMPRFGIPAADEAAADIVAKAFPDRQVVQVEIDAIAEGGGGIHCSTQQQPAPQE
jgi:agmatine deiminase